MEAWANGQSHAQEWGKSLSGGGDKKSLCAIRFFWPYLNDFVKLCHLEVIWCWSRVKSDKRDQLSAASRNYIKQDMAQS